MLLKRLTEASGVSGNEKEVRDLIIKEIEGHVDDIKIDRMGNIIAYRKGIKASKKLMVTAHMDEMGLIVTDIDEMGLLKFTTVGNIDKRVLVSKRVLIGKNKVLGVIGAKPIHLQKTEEWQNALDIEQLYIDIGASDKKMAEDVVDVGDYAEFESKYTEFGADLVKAKALDSRVGCSLLIELLKEIKDIEFYGVFTVMKEIGLRGAGPATYQVEPNISIILEGAMCDDMLKLEEHLMSTILLKGPAISLVDRTTLFDIDFRKEIAKIAKTNNIPFQYKKTSMGENDSGQIHTNQLGSVTATISVPCRNIHFPTSIISNEDYKNTYSLLKSILFAYKKGEL